jgi:hypothetical protein
MVLATTMLRLLFDVPVLLVQAEPATWVLSPTTMQLQT